MDLIDILADIFNDSVVNGRYAIQIVILE